MMDTVGSERAAIMVSYDAGPTGMLFATTKPGRTAALILANTAAHFRSIYKADARSLLPAIHVPTLILHRQAYAFMPLPQGEYLRDHIEGARLVVLPGSDGPLFWEAADQSLDAVQEFLTGVTAVAGLRGTGRWPRCSTPTSWTPPGSWSAWGTRSGAACWTCTTCWRAGWST